MVVSLVSWGNRRLRAKGFQFIAWDCNESSKMSLSVKTSVWPDLFHSDTVLVARDNLRTTRIHVHGSDVGRHDPPGYLSPAGSL
jgi:hypothetical protein